MNIYLCGFQGVGKTHFGKQLADALLAPFFDVDQEILKIRKAPTIRDFHMRVGEKAFRLIEEEVVQALCKNQGCVIALGGGSLESIVSQQHVAKSGRLFYLYRPMEEVRPVVLPHYIQEPFENFFHRRHSTFSTLAHTTIAAKVESRK